MPLRDYAIVVGIGAYPNFGPGDTPLNLHGPVADAEAVAAWLLDPNKGGLPDVDCILSTDANAGEPTRDRIELAMGQLDDIARRQIADGRGSLIGRRLYIYMSGHGFSPARGKGSLFVANAKERQSFNVAASGWLEWFQEAGYFREFVLWLDCCMDRLSFLPASEPSLARITGQGIPGPTFVGFAAQRPLRAAEITNTNGKVRGAFTLALLDGLNGAAVDANGRVTGRSLADWLRQATLGRMPATAIADPDVSKEPDIIREDAELIFARGVRPLLYDVTLAAPGAADGTVTIWSGVPPRPESEVALVAGKAQATLAPGLYHAQGSHSGLAASFEVIGNRNVALQPGCPPLRVATRDELFTLDFNPPTPTVEISVVDRRFAPVERSLGQISTQLPAGIFKLRTRSGRTVEDTVLLLDRNRDKLADEIDVSASVTVAPIPGTATAQAAPLEAVEAFVKVAADARNDAPAAQSSSITLMARAIAPVEAEVVPSQPWKGLSVRDAAGAPVFELKDGEVHGDDPRAPFAIHAEAVAPGSYFLQLMLDDGLLVEQSMIVPDGWSLEVYVLRRIGLDGKLDFRPRVSVQMARNDKPCPEEVRNLVEMARTALGDERPILSSELEDLLLRKFCNPMAGILGAHLLLLGQEAGQTFDPTLLDNVVERLRELVGKEHPDVEALSLRCNRTDLRRRTRLRDIPMLARSWRLLTGASYAQPNLLGVEQFRQLIAQTSLPPFLVWSIDEETRRNAVKWLVDETLGSRSRIEALREHAEEDAVPVAEMVAPAAYAAIPMMAALAPAPALLDPASRADLRLARQRAASLNLPSVAVKELFGALRDS